jgi:hypothetical protein
MSMAAKLRRAPTRAVTGAFILNSGLSKLKADDDTAAALHGMASGAYPFLESVPAKPFVRAMAVCETALGAALLVPIIPARTAGAGLTAFSGALLTMWWRTPGMHEGMRPTRQGTTIAKDVWMFGIGTGLLVDSVVGDAGDSHAVRKANRATSRAERKAEAIQRKAELKANVRSARKATRKAARKAARKAHGSPDLAAIGSELLERTADSRTAAREQAKATREAAKPRAKAARKSATKRAEAAHKTASKQAEAARKTASKQAKIARKSATKRAEAVGRTVRATADSAADSAHQAAESAQKVAERVADRVSA